MERIFGVGDPGFFGIPPFEKKERITPNTVYDHAAGAVRGVDVTAVATGEFKWSGCAAVGGAVVYDHAAGAVRGVDVSAVATGPGKWEGCCAVASYAR